MFWLKDARVRVGKVTKTTDKMVIAHLSSSEQKQDKSGYDYSNWSFSLFVGKAKTLFLELGLSEGDVITITQGKVTNTPYEKEDGTKVYNNPKVMVIDFEVYRKADAGKETPAPVVVDDEDSIPF